MLIDRLIDKIIKYQNPTVVGLDTDFDYLPDSMKKNCVNFKDVADQIERFNFNLIDALADFVPSVKVQVAYYESYGFEGLRAFFNTLNYANSKGMITIADVKRNDIGSTAAAYSRAYLSGVNIGGKLQTAFPSDFITVNGYLGEDGLLPFIDDCKRNDKGVFVLVKTSNPSSGQLQDKILGEDKTLYQNMADITSKIGKELIGKYGYSNIGAVVGATHKKQAKQLRDEYKSMFFLIPGYGAQGATGKDIAVSFDKDLKGGIVNSSRGIICAYKKEEYKHLDYKQAAVQAAKLMQEDLVKSIKG